MRGMDDWPERERREPRRDSQGYLMLSALARVLRQEIARTLSGRSGLRVLDVGCGNKPYYPFFAEHAAEYRGIDMKLDELADDIGSVDALPYPDGSFDVVLCTQVLEHVEDPSGAVRELFRVLRPGGTVFLSTHGVWVYHPDPVDLWRWTIEGLERLFRTSADGWDDVRVTPNGEVVACLACLANQYVTFVPLVGRWLVLLINLVAERLDPKLPPTLRGHTAGSLSMNFLVTATKRGEG